MKRLTLFAASAVLLCGLLASCGEKTPPVTSGETTTATAETDLKVPTADYEEHIFNFLSAGYVTYNDFDFEEESSMPLPNAQYKRRRKVEEDFKVTIKETLDKSYPTASVTAGPGYMKLITNYTSGDAEYDAALIAGYDVSGLSYVGALYDMASIDTLVGSERQQELYDEGRDLLHHGRHHLLGQRCGQHHRFQQGIAAAVRAGEFL